VTHDRAHCTGFHLIRSRALHQGYDVVKKLEAVGSTSGTPSKEAVIADSGVLAA
jgi:hypothetical protein